MTILNPENSERGVPRSTQLPSVQVSGTQSETDSEPEVRRLDIALTSRARALLSVSLTDMPYGSDELLEVLIEYRQVIRDLLGAS